MSETPVSGNAALAFFFSLVQLCFRRLAVQNSSHAVQATKVLCACGRFVKASDWCLLWPAAPTLPAHGRC